MTVVRKILLGGLGLALIAGGYWLLISKVMEQSAAIGELEQAKTQVERTLRTSIRETEQARRELELWRGLYSQLQDITTEINQQREEQQALLSKLREEKDVQVYLECPMPDDLYQWVRQN